MLRKTIVTNVGALKRKYKVAGWIRVRHALAKLIAADAQRGIATTLVAIDDEATMAALGGEAVDDAGDTDAVKAAVDAIAESTDVIVLLGAHDVIPHQLLDNPLWTGDEDDDPDQTVPSDLPYASSKPASTRIKDFVRSTRIVSRIPDLVAARTPAHMLANLETARTWRSRAKPAYRNGLTISTLSWKGATRSCATTLFGAASRINLSPQSGPDWTTAQLKRRMHFINCHGDAGSPEFWGEAEPEEGSDPEMPVAHRSSGLNAKIVDGTVVAAECCYGAELYDPSALGLSICQRYLGQGAYAFLGSTTVAYGPAAAPPGYADIICREFLRAIQRGLTTGEALAVARTELLGSMRTVTPTMQKTLAQFYVLGDATVQPVHGPAKKKLAGNVVLKKKLPAATSGGVAEPVQKGPSAAVLAAMARVAERQGLTLGTVQSYEAPNGGGEKGGGKKGSKAGKGRSRVHVVFADFTPGTKSARGAKKTKRSKAVKRKVLLEIEERGTVLTVRELQRK